jgi:hypothetical protein
VEGAVGVAFGGSEAVVPAAATGTLAAGVLAGASDVAALTSGALIGAAEAVEDEASVFFGSPFFDSLFFGSLFFSVFFGSLFFLASAVCFGSRFASDFFEASSPPVPLRGATLLTLSDVEGAWLSSVCIRAARLGTTVANNMAVRHKTFFMVHSNF